MMLSSVGPFLKAWTRNLFSPRTASALLSSFGILWVFIQITGHFFPDTKVAEHLQSGWIWFLLTGAAIALAMCRPRMRHTAKLNGRDVHLEVAVGSVFDYPGILIVGTNTTFDTKISPGLISPKSVQGQFTKRYCKDQTTLDEDIAVFLSREEYTHLPGERQGNDRDYPVGTVARVESRSRTAYFVAIARLNSNGVATGSFDDLKTSLARLWWFAGNRGSKDALVIPILGSGFSRLTTPREQIAREIIGSFVAACSERVFCEKLTVVIHPSDLTRYKISMSELWRYLDHVCTYTEFSRALGEPSNQTGI